MINSFRGRWAFLSNFYPCKIDHQGITYPSTEHFYVAMKVNTDQLVNGRMLPVSDVREMISKITTPGQAKRFGKTLSLRKDWDEVRLKVMEFGLREKFKDEKLLEMLLQTGAEELVEGNWWKDTYWGVCNGFGSNNLGKLLMKIRSEIQSTLGLFPSPMAISFTASNITKMSI